MILHTRCARCRQGLTLPAPSRYDTYCPDCLPPHDSPSLHLHELEDAFLLAVLAADASQADRLAVELDDTQRATEAFSGLSAAIAYASYGWPVFPLRTGGSDPDRYKQPATKNGLNDATTDVDRIERYWTRQPNAGIGVATGHMFDAIDIDFRHDGVARVWADIKDGPIEIDALVTTPHGVHAYVLPTGNGNRAEMRGVKGIDYRGRGGYVVVPPTWRPDGRYVWQSKPSARILR